MGWWCLYTVDGVGSHWLCLVSGWLSWAPLLHQHRARVLPVTGGIFRQEEGVLFLYSNTPFAHGVAFVGGCRYEVGSIKDFTL